MTDSPASDTVRSGTTRDGRPEGVPHSYPVEIVVGLLIVAVLYGGWVRFHYLTRESLWLDELWTWQIADSETLSDVLWNSPLRKDVHPPLHFIMYYFLQKYVGDSEWDLRVPSATAGVLTIIVMFVLGRRLYSETEGLIAAGLTAVLFFPIHYSQEARAYMMLGLFTTLSAWLWVCMMEPLCTGRRPKTWAVVGYVVTATMAAALHYFGLLIIGLEALAATALLAWRRPRALPLLPLAYLPVVGYYVWGWPMMRRALGMRHFWIKEPGYDAFYDYIRRLFNLSDVLAWAALAVLAWTVGMMLYRRFGKHGPANDTSGTRLPFRDLLLVSWLVVPFVIAFVRSRLSTPVLTNKNLIIVMPAAYLLVARGVTLVPVRRWVHGLLGTLITVGLAVHLFVGLKYGRIIFNDQFRGAVQLVTAARLPPEECLVVAYSYSDRFFDYYFDRLHTGMKTDLFAGREKDIVKLAETVARRQPKYIFFLWGHMNPDTEFLGYICDEQHGLCRNYRRVQGVQLHRVYVVFLVRRDVRFGGPANRTGVIP